MLGDSFAPEHFI